MHGENMPTQEEMLRELLKQQRPSNMALEPEGKKLDQATIEALRRSFMGGSGAELEEESEGMGPLRLFDENRESYGRRPGSEDEFQVDPDAIAARDRVLSRTAPEAPYEVPAEIQEVLRALAEGEMPDAEMAPVSMEDELGEKVVGDEYEGPELDWKPPMLLEPKVQGAKLDLPEEESEEMGVEPMKFSGSGIGPYGSGESSEMSESAQDPSYDALEKIRSEREEDLMRKIKELK